MTSIWPSGDTVATVALLEENFAQRYAAVQIFGPPLRPSVTWGRAQRAEENFSQRNAPVQIFAPRDAHLAHFRAP